MMDSTRRLDVASAAAGAIAIARLWPQRSLQRPWWRLAVHAIYVPYLALVPGGLRLEPETVIRSLALAAAASWVMWWIASGRRSRSPASGPDWR